MLRSTPGTLSRTAKLRIAPTTSRAMPIPIPMVSPLCVIDTTPPPRHGNHTTLRDGGITPKQEKPGPMGPGAGVDDSTNGAALTRLVVVLGRCDGPSESDTRLVVVLS